MLKSTPRWPNLTGKALTESVRNNPNPDTLITIIRN